MDTIKDNFSYTKNDSSQNTILFIYNHMEHLSPVIQEDYIINHQEERESLKTFQKNPKQYKMIIIDHNLSSNGGIKLAEELIQIRSDIPVVILRSQGDGISIKEKPMKSARIMELARTVKKMLEKKKKLSDNLSSVFVVRE